MARPSGGASERLALAAAVAAGEAASWDEAACVSA